MSTEKPRPRWSGPGEPAVGETGIQDALARLDEAVYILRGRYGLGAAVGGSVRAGGEHEVVAAVPPMGPERLGSGAFLAAYGVREAYMSGAMANGIASADLVIAMARAGYLASYGAAGLLPETVEKALGRFAAEIPGLPYACNLIHSPSEERLERTAIDLYLHHKVPCVEASAFLGLTPHIVRYRLAGLRAGGPHGVVAENKVIAKISRTEIAEQFIRPAPEAMVRALLEEGAITAEQARLAEHMPLADDITVEADSGGHTDRRPLPAQLPVIMRQRDALMKELGYPTRIRVGAAGGIGTPEAAWAAFAMGADYVVTGSVNQSCVEAGTSTQVKEMLAQADLADFEMAPAADMFEMGVELQVLKRGTLFPMRARLLYELYRNHDGIDDLPAAARRRIETQIFRRPLEDVWAETVSYFERRDPDQLARAAASPKRRAALVFRWYLGMASRWAKTGEADRAVDYQIWCGPSMGSFNSWVRGTYLAAPRNRHVADVARHIMAGAAFHQRLSMLRAAGLALSPAIADYPVPQPDQALEVRP
ncbi:PfaD family polyunsaturated fatty acid/polyketide biosynthesis protein [Streptomyces pseudovenezuelae]|uniref:Trans-AT polyketide synthase/acyltransferase/oxidoreductase domain-containing protein n=1 Tax=Streptomyces pseudovenezuelae TaxID=67350 RepID=A0ABT6LKN8_9ACTN|nr:PfaD family polyunsaturated fatty acid/polyketide biosynthesis protein [Streptomyces pseudovenezuelae]MDH6216864.1 trans-AT polyketide synthase/acyltransferase/oxidoreductase domain-containing protein [Streptomyces pseudovenezuelae]